MIQNHFFIHSRIAPPIEELRNTYNELAILIFTSNKIESVIPWAYNIWNVCKVTEYAEHNLFSISAEKLFQLFSFWNNLNSKNFVHRSNYFLS